MCSKVLKKEKSARFKSKEQQILKSMQKGEGNVQQTEKQESKKYLSKTNKLLSKSAVSEKKIIFLSYFFRTSDSAN